jgi:lipoprotein-anchoring transpeptidase ErfK/SrfK
LLFVAFAVLAGTALCLPQDRASHPNRAARPTVHSAPKPRRATRPIGLDIAKINDPNTTEPLWSGSQGDAVVRAAILLDRIKFSPGEISRNYTENFGKAVSAFQRANGLTATGNVDPTTWQKLNAAQPAAGPPPSSQQHSEARGQSDPSNLSLAGSASQQGQNQQQPPMAAPAIVAYVIALQDVAGPFTKLPTASGSNAGEQLMLREAKLKQLNYESATQLLGEKFHCSPALLRQLNPRKAFDKAGTQINVPNVETTDPPKTAKVVVDGSNKSVEALDGSGKILAFYPATLGSEHDPLPAGDWKITEITRYPHFKYNPNLFWDSENKTPRATLPPGPKSPVGVVWIGISKEHYGIHGTSNPSKIGATESHGCIRLTNWDALELSKIVSVGMPVMIS